ncbi:hypothetical protein ACTXT7_009093 [Hymenolepis weldensis]
MQEKGDKEKLKFRYCINNRSAIDYGENLLASLCCNAFYSELIKKKILDSPLCLRRLAKATIRTASTALVFIFIFYRHNPIFRSFKQLLSALTDQAPTASNHGPALSQACCISLHLATLVFIRLQLMTLKSYPATNSHRPTGR